MTAPFRFPRFFVTSPSPCPYLPGRQERKVFTELNGPHAGELNDALGRIGFRRSQSVAYRPSCAGCNACMSVRVVTDEFKPNASQRKLLKRYADIEVTACRPWATDEQYRLLRRYLSTRHPTGGMSNMDDADYADMVEQSPVSSYVIEYREPRNADGKLGKLIGACITDQQLDGLSMIYSFFAADDETRPGLGNFIILDHIQRAHCAGLPYVYLGYWVKGSARMEYKIRYRPIEALGPNGWMRLGDDDEPTVVMAPRETVQA
ncbi:arginyltransferase [Sphingomonas sp. AX6]|uniref:arginyltransferase n=1 Tax=Sphingomonas sp. AX6 TaxID=2653171 RepID=UPI0012F0E0C9|nr:arginyltransferase [Sphingomonas sp. AX6]VXC86062.1 Aspartate/glutamate leucyltransferase [Sphingomonas sp. AX6]